MAKILEISNRLRDGRAVKTNTDFHQWLYEQLDSFLEDVGMDWTPIDVFPTLTKIMCAWCDNTRGCNIEKENAQALTQAIGELTQALKKCLNTGDNDGPTHSI